MPVKKPIDIGFIGSKPPWMVAYEIACRQCTFDTAQSVVPQENISPALLHHGLNLAPRAGDVDVAWGLRVSGARIVRQTPLHILDAPANHALRNLETAWLDT